MRILLASILLVLAVAVGRGIIPSAPTMPQCQEDAVIIGTGDFDHGRWSAYVCGPSVDDYDPAR